MTTPLIQFAGYWTLYLGFTVFVVLLLALDLRLERHSHTSSVRRAAGWSAAWILLAVAFGIALYVFAGWRFGAEAGRRMGLEYAAGYLLEKSLSVDNLFVFALVFRYFAIPVRYQHRVLFYGVLGAIVLRGAFIAVGAALIRFEAVFVAFGVFLIYSGIRFAWSSDQRLDPEQSTFLRLLRRFVPVTGMHGSQLLALVGGRLHATPLLIVIFFLEATDVVFAVDSVPAVFGVTREPFVVYSSNLFAILGLRSLFLLLAHGLERFHALRYGLAAVLVFVGLKMVWLDHLAGGRFSIGASVAIIAAAIGISIAASFIHIRHIRPGRLAAAAVCLLLATGAVLCAAGPLRDRLPFLSAAAPGALYFSAACYAGWGIALVCGELRRSASQGRN